MGWWSSGYDAALTWQISREAFSFFAKKENLWEKKKGILALEFESLPAHHIF